MENCVMSRKKRRSQRPWSAEELEKIRNEYATKSRRVLAREMGRTRSAVSNAAHKLGLYFGGRPNAVHSRQYRWQLRHPEKTAAHQAVTNALRKGTLIKPESCERCGADTKLEAHHPDYTQRLSVEWLCHSCHSAIPKAPRCDSGIPKGPRRSQLKPDISAGPDIYDRMKVAYREGGYAAVETLLRLKLNKPIDPILAAREHAQRVVVKFLNIEGEPTNREIDGVVHALKAARLVKLRQREAA
jgi:hypothetical protein